MLVDVARQLFAKKGIANTTMNDIAVASGKGRRTLYTYFNRKEEIFSAVIESELERLSEKLDEVANKKIPPQEKIIELINEASAAGVKILALPELCVTGYTCGDLFFQSTLLEAAVRGLQTLADAWRNKRFAEIAAASGVSQDAVRRRSLAKFEERVPAGSGVWIQDAAGGWRQK